jgi:hypothetical protein
MLIIIEILFLIAGLMLLVSGEVPSKLFQIMFGKGDYQLSPTQARLFGLLLASPLPIGLIAADFEIVYLIVVAIVAIIIARRSKQSKLPNKERSESRLN